MTSELKPAITATRMYVGVAALIVDLVLEFKNDQEYFGRMTGNDYVEVIERLQSLPDDTPVEEVNAILGVSHWTTLGCDFCGKASPFWVSMHVSTDGPESYMIMCSRCIASAAKLIEESGGF